MDNSQSNTDKFFDPNERPHIILGRRRYVYRSKYVNGQDYLHIRLLAVGEGGRLKFTPKGVNLTYPEWYELKRLLLIGQRFLVSFIPKTFHNFIQTDNYVPNTKFDLSSRTQVEFYIFRPPGRPGAEYKVTSLKRWTGNKPTIITLNENELRQLLVS